MAGAIVAQHRWQLEHRKTYDRACRRREPERREGSPRFHQPRRPCRVPACPKPRSGPASTASCTTWRRRTARCSRSATSCRRRSTRGIERARANPSTSPPTRRSWRDRLPRARRAPTSRSTPPNVDAEIAAHRRAAAGRAGRPTPATRSTPPTPAGAASTTRSTAPTRSPRTTAPTRGGGYNPVRGGKVIACGQRFLDEVGAARQRLATPTCAATPSDGRRRCVRSPTGRTARSDPASADPAAVRRLSRRAGGRPRAILLRHNGLHIEIQIDRRHPIGKDRHRRHRRRACSRRRVTTIVDCEDSVAAVDAEDKVAAYRNWLGLMKGTLDGAASTRAAQPITRRLNPDRDYTAPDGGDARPCPAAACCWCATSAT